MRHSVRSSVLPHMGPATSLVPTGMQWIHPKSSRRWKLTMISASINLAAISICSIPHVWWTWGWPQMNWKISPHQTTSEPLEIGNRQNGTIVAAGATTITIIVSKQMLVHCQCHNCSELLVLVRFIHLEHIYHFLLGFFFLPLCPSTCVYYVKKNMKVRFNRMVWEKRKCYRLLRRFVLTCITLFFFLETKCQCVLKYKREMHIHPPPPLSLSLYPVFINITFNNYHPL